MTQKRVGLIGWPVKHSKSPLIHHYWMQRYGIDACYEAVEVASENLKSAVETMLAEGFSGFNVTVPHKVAVLNLLNEVSETAQKAGAVNTVSVRSDGSLFGDNTDGFGFVENIRESCNGFDFTGKTAVILGTGGAARGIYAALVQEGCAVRLVCRTREKGELLAQEIGGDFRIFDWKDRKDALEGADLLANATTLGMDGFNPLDIGLDGLSVSAVVADAVYAPLDTDLLIRARAKGYRTADGLGMLLHQARGGFKAWFGIDPEVTAELRRIVSA